MDQTDSGAAEIITEIKELLLKVADDTEGLVMTSYESLDDGVHCYNYELLSLEGLRAGYFTDQEDVPEDEEELLETILELDLEPWDTLEAEELIELRDYLRTETASD